MALGKEVQVLRIPRAPMMKYLNFGLVVVCCLKAEKSEKSCVCVVVTECEDHGEEHHGSHE